MMATPDQCTRAQLCHFNMLKPYYRKNIQESSLVCAEEDTPLVLLYCNDGGETQEFLGPEPVVHTEHWEQNSTRLLEKLDHIEMVQKEEMLRRLRRYPSVISNAPRKTHPIEHDIDVREVVQVKLSPYRVNALKQKLAEKELEYLLEHEIVIGTYVLPMKLTHNTPA